MPAVSDKFGNIHPRKFHNSRRGTDPTSRFLMQALDLNGDPELVYRKLDDIKKTSWVSTRSRWLYLATPKVACTSIKLALQLHEGLPVPDRMSLVHSRKGDRQLWVKCLADLSPDDAEEALFGDSYFRFTFVRNPLTRLLSAFKQKILSDHDDAFADQRKQVFGEGKIPQQGEQAIAGFGSFVDMVEASPDEARDKHWRSQWAVIQGKHIKYDLIGRLEHFERDIATVLDTLGASARTRQSIRRRRNVTDARKTWSDWYSDSLITRVYRLYERDFREFRYHKGGFDI